MGTFSHSEMQNRLNCLTGVMEDADVEAIIATSFHNVLYYSDFWMTPFGRGHYAVMMKAGEGALIAPRIEFDRPANYSWFDDVRIYWDTKSPLEGSVRLIGGNGRPWNHFWTDWRRIRIPDGGLPPLSPRGPPEL